VAAIFCCGRKKEGRVEKEKEKKGRRRKKRERAQSK
jgi:hypothetical protein